MISGSNQAAVFSTTFANDVKLACDGKGKLTETVVTVNNIQGKGYVFNLSTGGEAKERGAIYTDLTPMGSTTAPIAVVFQDIIATEFVDSFEELKTNFSIQQNLTTNIARAISRKKDSVIVGALDNASEKTIDSSTEILNVATIRAAMAQLDEDECDEDDRHIAFGAKQKSALLGTVEVTSSDYSNVRALVNGEVDTFLGFKFHMMGKRLPEDAGVRTIFAWHKSCVGLAMGQDVKTSNNYSASKDCEVITSKFSGEAAIIDPAGVVKISVLDVAAA